LYWFNQRSGKSIERASAFENEKEVVILQKTRFDLKEIYNKEEGYRKDYDMNDEVNHDKSFELFPDADIIIELEEI